MTVKFTVYGSSADELRDRAGAVLADFVAEGAELPEFEIEARPLLQEYGKSGVSEWLGEVVAEL
jgi:hypothetical protein